MNSNQGFSVLALLTGLSASSVLWLATSSLPSITGRAIKSTGENNKLDLATVPLKQYLNDATWCSTLLPQNIELPRINSNDSMSLNQIPNSGTLLLRVNDSIPDIDPDFTLNSIVLGDVRESNAPNQVTAQLRLTFASLHPERFQSIAQANALVRNFSVRLNTLNAANGRKLYQSCAIAGPPQSASEMCTQLGNQWINGQCVAPTIDGESICNRLGPEYQWNTTQQRCVRTHGAPPFQITEAQCSLLRSQHWVWQNANCVYVPGPPSNTQPNGPNDVDSNFCANLRYLCGESFVVGTGHWIIDPSVGNACGARCDMELINWPYPIGAL